MARKRGTRKRSAARSGNAAVQRFMRVKGMSWYIGRWAATGRKVIPGMRRKGRR